MSDSRDEAWATAEKIRRCVLAARLDVERFAIQVRTGWDVTKDQVYHDLRGSR